jgi:mannose-6-phosphate isomerase-like protein (cupin superfamily)
MANRYFVRAAEGEAYAPANHEGTVNRRLIGPGTVGSRNVEVLHGTMQPGKGALPHAHPGIEQVCYVLEGRAAAEVGGERQELGPGDCCFFPAGTPHAFSAIGDRPARILVIYSPPYEERTDRTVR